MFRYFSSMAFHCFSHLEREPNNCSRRIGQGVARNKSHFYSFRFLQRQCERNVVTVALYIRAHLTQNNKYVRCRHGLLITYLPFFQDINECDPSGLSSEYQHLAHICHDDANCTNTKGSYYCACLEGYSGNGISCQGEQSIQFLTRRICGFPSSIGKLKQFVFCWFLKLSSLRAQMTKVRSWWHIMKKKKPKRVLVIQM